MFDTSEIMKILGICLAAIIVVKAIAPVVATQIWEILFGTKKKKNSDIDFDALVSQKKAILRGGGEGASGQAFSSQSHTKGQTEEIIQKSYSDLSKKSKRSPQEEKVFEDLKETLKLLDSLQWGSLPQVATIQKKLSQTYTHRFKDENGTAQFKFLLQKNAFLNQKGDWVGLDKALLTLESFLLLHELVHSSTLRTILAKRWLMNPSSLEKSLLLNLLPKKTSLKKLVSLQTPQIPPLKEVALLGFLTLSAGVLKNKNTFLNELKAKAEIFQALSPLPPLSSKSDTAGALRIMGLPEKASLETIKSRYKKLAQLKHPDTLKAKGIPAEFESIATENFTQIKAAYDILVKDRS